VSASNGELRYNGTMDEMKVIQPQDPAFKFVVETVGDDLVIRNVTATWFSGPGDPSDTGRTASGVSTRDNPKLLGCALPMDGFHFHKTDGSPIPRLPWGTLVRVVNRISGQMESFPLIDLGPSKYAASGAAIDLTATAFRLLGGNTDDGVVQVDVIVPRGARFLPKTLFVVDHEQGAPKISTGERKRFPWGLHAFDARAIFRPKRAIAKPAVKSFIESPNYSSRNGTGIDMIVLHCTTAATAGGTINWFLNRKSQVSSHYVVDKNGDIYQMVRDECSAWHAKAVNSRSIGIEHVATASDRLTDAQSLASAQLVRWLAAAYGVPVANVLGHKFALGNERTTDCPNHLFGDTTADAVAEWVNKNIAHALGSREFGRSRPVVAEPIARRALQLPGWAKPSMWLAKVRSDLSRIHQNVRPLPHSPAVALTALELMTIALEDRRFFYHLGIDVRSIVRETLKALKGRKHGGASTIDMQFVRTATGFREPTIRRKIYEAFLALMIQSRYKKLEILRSYLACAFFGSGLIGADAAAQRIFNKNADRLAIEEASFIGAMLAYPRPLHELPRWELRARRRAAYAVEVFSLRKGHLAGPYEIAPPEGK